MFTYVFKFFPLSLSYTEEIPKSLLDGCTKDRNNQSKGGGTILSEVPYLNHNTAEFTVINEENEQILRGVSCDWE